MMGRYILPWFGGGPAVWTNCLLFFQTLSAGGLCLRALAGIAAEPAGRCSVHVTLLAASLLFLPIAPRADVWKPASRPPIRCSAS